MSTFEIEDLRKTLAQHLPTEVCKEVNRLLYGNPCRYTADQMSFLHTIQHNKNIASKNKIIDHLS